METAEIESAGPCGATLTDATRWPPALEASASPIQGTALALSLPHQRLAFTAHRLTAGTLTQVLSLDVVSCVTVRADVMDVALDGVPGVLSHILLLWVCA